jgi:hypothetical protein
VAAAGLPEIGAADPHPLEVGRRRQHLPQQFAVPGLDSSPFAQLQASLADRLRESVAQALQLTEVEQTRLRGKRLHPVLQLDPAESLGEEAGQLPLEARDLASQLEPSKTLVDLDAKRHPAVSEEQIGHRPAPSVDHARAVADNQRASSTAAWETPFT